jgi:hypothetical protein
VWDEASPDAEAALTFALLPPSLMRALVARIRSDARFDAKRICGKTLLRSEKGRIPSLLFFWSYAARFQSVFYPTVDEATTGHLGRFLSAHRPGRSRPQAIVMKSIPVERGLTLAGKAL